MCRNAVLIPATPVFLFNDVELGRVGIPLKSRGNFLTLIAKWLDRNIRSGEVYEMI